MGTLFELAGRHRIQKAGSRFRPCDWGGDSESRCLPPDLTDEAARRLGIASLVYAAMYFLAYFVAGAFDHPEENLFRFWFLDTRSWIAWGAIGFALFVFAMSRSGRMPPHKILNAGLGLMVVGSAGIAACTFWGFLPDGLPDHDHDKNYFIGIPWEAVWIIIAAGIAPNRPRNVAIAAFLSASAGPVVTFLSRASGATPPDVTYGFLIRYFLFTNYMCAAVAWLGSLYIHHLGRHLREARALGSYELVEKLGAGGMGEVWRAEHRMLARPAAVKLIKQEMLGEGPIGCSEIRGRFEREAQATAQLHSRHTVNVFDFGATPDGRFYYVMELLDGIALDELVKRFGPQRAERVVSLLIQVCDSLHDAHRSDFIHRDIKPGNIVVCRYGHEFDFVKVLDFGLVKSTNPDAPAEGDLTQIDATPGTPGYLSPEMALARPDVDGRADLYSLGGVAYWLLTGTPVFEGTTPLETAAMHLKDDPAPPSQRSEIEIPRDLEEIILSCLAKDPADRPADAGELAARLAACSAAGGWTQERARRWWRVNDPLRARARETVGA